MRRIGFWGLSASKSAITLSHPRGKQVRARELNSGQAFEARYIFENMLLENAVKSNFWTFKNFFPDAQGKKNRFLKKEFFKIFQIFEIFRKPRASGARNNTLEGGGGLGPPP